MTNNENAITFSLMMHSCDANEKEGRIVQWENYVSASENILGSPQVPSSLEIINLIKKVNPTKLYLSETDRERGYQLKNRLQSLLLEQYGDAFHLIPHPANPHIILIKHRLLPSIDACHADVASLSSEAIDRVDTAEPLLPVKGETKGNREHAPRQPEMKGAALSPRRALKEAQALLEEYDYAAAEEVVAGLLARGSDDLRVLLRAAAILLHEIGAYQRCIDTLQNQPKNVLKDREIRETLAVAYHHNGSIAEARAILDELNPAELGLEALFAYADIAFKDGNLTAALELVRIAKGREGYFTGLDGFQKEIETALSAQTEPLVQKAEAALQSDDLEEARRFAREALDLHPNCAKARAVISAVKAKNREAQRLELWESLENERSCERRIALLSTLLERDKERKDEIKNLLAEERERQRRRLFDEQLQSLASLVGRESWPECFDGVTQLMKHPEFGERAVEVLSLSPYFSVLHENKQLHSTTDRGAKDLWLRFVKVKLALAAGDADGCFETMEELKPWFGSCPEFKEDYLPLLQREQEKARAEIALLLEQSEAPECAVSEVRQVHVCLKRKKALLPIEERRELSRTMEGRLARLIPEPDPAQLLDEYREALQIGNGEKAAYLRQEITDTAATEALEAEFAEAFHIDWEPLTLEMSDELPIDLVTAPPLRLMFNNDHSMLLKDGSDTLIMIDFAAKAACRMTSPVFSQAGPIDSTQRGTFLFRERNSEKEYGDRLWRAELSVERAALTASFDMRQWFDIEDGCSVDHVCSSSERDTDYFILVKHAEGRGPAKVLRKRLAPKATIETLQIGNRKDLELIRWGSYPDHFLVGGTAAMKHVNRNLSVKTSVWVTPDIYAIDHRDGHVYGMEDSWLTRRDGNLKFVKYYDRAKSLALYKSERLHGLSFETDTALIVVGESKQVFYNMANNKFSNKIRAGRVIPSRLDGKWYSFDYSRNEGKLWLRDITHDIHTELEWKEFFFPKENRKKMIKKMVWFNESDNFVYRPEDWGPCERESVGE